MMQNRKPLTNKDATDFEELYAMNILSELFPYYEKLQHYDKPDIIDLDNGVGVEVVQAINPAFAAAYNERSLSFYETDVNRMNKRRAKMKNYGEPFQEGCQVWNKQACTIKDIEKAISKKCKKYCNYEKCSINDLYVGTFFQYSVCDDISAECLCKSVSEYISKIACRFRYVYVETNEFMFRFDVNGNSYTKTSISRDISIKCQEEAMVSIVNKNN